jgi:hypothetical protein
MSKKMMLLALAAVSAAMFAMPAAASAGEWKIHPLQASTIAGGATSLKTANGDTVNCTSSNGTGTQTTETTGTIELTFNGCTGPFGSNCSNVAGQPNRITTTPGLVTHNIYLEDNKTKLGILITGNGAAKHFASFHCTVFGFITIPIVVSGSVIGEVDRACGSVSKTSTVTFASTAHGVQKWMKITNTGSTFDLTANNNGTNETASQDGDGTVTTANNTTVTCV